MIDTAHLKIDFGTDQGPFALLHGINNGPSCFGGIVDLTDWHRKLQLPSTRLHDAEWPNPVVVDIPAIYPDFWADPEDPASYRFARTDDYLAALAPLTDNIIYRLGTSIEHTQTKYDTAPPTSFEQWARICIGVIKHLNEGWADGHHFGITDFEIWNEPDIGNKMWSGTQQQYLDLYAVAATAIKQHDPSLHVGGPVVADPYGDLGPNFLDFVAAHDLPLDFFAWHRYAPDPWELAEIAGRIRHQLDERGFTAVDSYLTEWNWVTEWHWEGKPAREMHRRNRGARGAAFVAASMILLQECGLQQAAFYTGDTQWFGMFDEFGIPQKNYYGLLAAGTLLRSARRVSAETSGARNLVAAAGAGDERDDAVVLIGNFEDEAVDAQIDLRNLPFDTWTCQTLVIDDEHDLEAVSEITASCPTSTLRHRIGAGTVEMLTFSRVE